MNVSPTAWFTGIVALAVIVGMPVGAAASSIQTGNDWIDAVTNAVLIERRGGGGHPGVRWEPYLGQLQVARTQFERGDVEATYKAMNRFMDMLERREGGIRPEVAEAIWDYCYQVTPPAFYDEKRHKRRWDKTVGWEKFFWEE